MVDYEIVIVGAGPAGCAAALMLAILDSDLAGQTLLLDKAIFPRPKVCAGGVTNDAELLLSELGVRIEVPSVPVHVSKFLLPDGSLTYYQANQFRVVRRTDLDYYLLQKARDRRIVVRDGEGVHNIEITRDGLVVRTSKTEYKANLVIGADGANGIVRRFLGRPRSDRLMVGLEVFVPTKLIGRSELSNSEAIFDFTMASYKLPGYFWVFPALDDSFGTSSIGFMKASTRVQELSSVREVFARWLGNHGLDLAHFDLMAHPALRYEPKAPYSQHRFLLAGDAAGIDPLFGEGITSALATGIIAAQSAFEGIRKNDFAFCDYSKRIRTSYVGTLMRRRCILAHRLHKPQCIGQRSTPYDALLNWVAPLNVTDTQASIVWRPSLGAAP